MLLVRQLRYEFASTDCHRFGIAKIALGTYPDN